MATKLELTPEITVSEVAAAYPETLRMLEALGIDYCCGGKRPLAEAAGEAGLPVEKVIAVLENTISQTASTAGAGVNWQEAPLPDLMAHIVEKHHSYMHSELPRLEHILNTVARVHGPNHPEELLPLVRVYAELKEELESHLKKEEEVTFPAIERLLHGNVDEVVVRTVRELEEEHERAGAALTEMHRVTHDFALPADACTTFAALYEGLQALEQDIHQHIHLENNILFPRVRRLAP